MNSRDEEFSKRLASTLDASVDALDDETRAQLAARRRRALTSRSRSRRIVGGLALAASLAAALVLVPQLWREGAALHDRGQEVAMQRIEPAANGGSEDMAYLSVDPQLLDDMDMLQAMDELQGDEDLAPAGNVRGES